MSLLAEQRERVRFVGYREAEEDCDRLAARLLEEIGARELRRCSFRPIPRGGLIVLGMLSYLLDLPASSLLGTELGQRLVVVDDCAITGARFRAAIARSSAPEVIFAHLYSPAALRAAIERAEPQARCLAAHDLIDRIDELGQKEQEEWRRLWRSRLGEDPYYLGRVDPVAFSWTEADRPLWNRAASSLESGWRLMSPEICLRNRGRLGPPAISRPSRVWRVASNVASAERSGGFLLCDTRGGEVVALDGSAAEIWRRLARHGDPELAAAELSELYGVARGEIHADVDRLATELRERGVLERVSGGEHE